MAWARIGLGEHDFAFGVVVEPDQLEVARREAAGEGGLGGAGLVAAVAERDLSGRDVPAFIVVGLHAFELDPGDLEGNLVGRIGESLVNPVTDFEGGDFVARERGDLPDDVLPLAILQGDVVGFGRAVLVTQNDADGKHGEAGDLGADPEGDAVVAAPVLVGDGALHVDRGEAVARGRRVAEEFHVNTQGAHGDRSGGLRPTGFGLPGHGPCFGIGHVVEQARVEHLLVEPAEFRGVLKFDGHGEARLGRRDHGRAGQQAEPENIRDSHGHSRSRIERIAV